MNKLTSLIGDDETAYDVPEVVDFFKSYPKIAEAFPKIKGLALFTGAFPQPGEFTENSG